MWHAPDAHAACTQWAHSLQSLLSHPGECFAGARRLGPGMSVVVGGRVASGHGCTRLVFGPAHPAAGSTANTIERGGTLMDIEQ